jgi:hypothetical protein
MPTVCRKLQRLSACWHLIYRYCAYPVCANFSMLCTMQYRFHCVLTFSRPRWLKRVKRLLCRMLANTGSTVPMRWLQSFLPLGESMAQLEIKPWL